MKLVSIEEITTVCMDLGKYSYFGLDTETTGLKETDRPFLIIIATPNETYLFNLNAYEGMDAKFILTESDLEPLNWIFQDITKTFFIQNAKFDMRMIDYLPSLKAPVNVHCTYATERVIKNNYFGDSSYSLKSLAERYFPGTPKDDEVGKYISKHKLYTSVKHPGKAKIDREMHFERVPWDIMMPYAARDAELHLIIGLLQIKKIFNSDDNLKGIPSTIPPILPVYENEKALTTTCFKMERRGISIDKRYTAKALSHELLQIANAKIEFKKLTGFDFIDSNKLFAEVFTKMGEKYSTTEKGNPSFNADSLEDIDTPVARAIKTVRNHEKFAGTYYSSFLASAGEGAKIHPDMRQAGTETGRFSYRNPNLQNVPKQDMDGLDFYVRKCFVPDPGKSLFMIDYQQQEFRMMLDYAGEMGLIKAVMNGADVHQATADIVNISRSQAKTINFGLIYGMGTEKLAKALNLSVSDAREIRLEYFGKLPHVERFIKAVTRAGEARGFIYNWFGRRCHIERREWSYILPNHLIQGSCADVVKVAMNKIDDLNLEGVEMLLQVHDELIFQVKDGYESQVKKIADIMENVYKPANGMKLTTSTEYSTISWGHPDRMKYEK